MAIYSQCIQLMKTDNKNKASSNKICPNSITNTKTNQNFNLSQHRFEENGSKWNDELIYFHLNDEQPESLHAKRKLQQISVELQEQNVINPHQRNQDTMKLFKRNQKIIQQAEHAGWIDGGIDVKEKSRSSNKNYKNNRTFSATRSLMSQGIQLKAYEKKNSLNKQKIPDNKINLSFNNLLPVSMERIHQNEISREIMKRVKNTHIKRPSTACYSGASQKIITLFDKNEPKIGDNGQTLRIHSGKDLQQKNGNLVTFKGREKFLKTCPFNVFHMNYKKNRHNKDDSKLLTQNNFEQNEDLNKQIQSNQKTFCRNPHFRTYSEPIQKVSKQNTSTQNHVKPTLPHRKNQIMTDKRSILDKKIKSHHLITASNTKNNSTGRYKEKDQISLQRQINLTKTSKDSTSFAEQEKFDLNRTAKTSNASCHKRNIQAPISSNLEQDFSLLINLLKHESHNVVGGQLHSYLNHMKNIKQYNCYMSAGVNKQKRDKNHLKISINDGKVGIPQCNSESLHFKVATDQQVTKNNTAMHYTSLSTSKHKARDSGFLIGGGMEKQFRN